VFCVDVPNEDKQLIVEITATKRGNRNAPVKTPVISHTIGEDREVFNTGGTNSWPFVTQIFRNRSLIWSFNFTTHMLRSSLQFAFRVYITSQSKL